MDDHVPKVTVLVTAYNHEPFIAGALESVLAQQVAFDYEILIGEDCSHDRTRQIVAAFVRKHPGMARAILPRRNLGHGGAPLWLRCLEAARGEYVALLDGDDYWTSREKLALQVRLLDEHPESVLALHNAEARVEHTQVSWTLYPAGRPDEWTLQDLLRESTVQCSTMVLRKRGPDGSVLAWAASLRPESAVDWDIAVRAAQYGAVRYVDRVLSVYRQTPRGVWSSLGRAEQLSAVIKRYDRVKLELGAEYRSDVEQEIAVRSFEAAQEYEEIGALKQAERYLTRCLAIRPPSLEQYAAGIGSLGAGVWDVLDTRRRAYRHWWRFRAKRLAAAIEDWTRWKSLTIRQAAAKTASLVGGRSAGILRADPQTVRERPGSPKVGTTRLHWAAIGAEEIEIRVGTPSGPLFRRDVARGSADTGPWVQDRMAFFLQDVSCDPPRTLDVIRVRVKPAGY